MKRLRATVIRFSVRLELRAQVLEALVGLQVRYRSTVTSSRDSARTARPAPAGTSPSLGVIDQFRRGWIEVALARASITRVSVSCSKFASP